MADVKAPLAKLDGDDWQEFNEFSFLSGFRDSPEGFRDSPDKQGTKMLAGDRRKETANGRNCSSESVGNCINTGDSKIVGSNLEENLYKCYRRIESLDNAASEVEVKTQERVINDSEVWNQLSSRLDNIQLVSWPQSHACQLQENSLSLKEASENDCVVESLDLSDDEDLQQSLDLHGLIISSQTEVQPIKTADEVISEIEEMMQDEFDMEQSSVTIDGPSKTAQIIRMKLKQAMPPGTTMIECLKNMSASDLSTLQDELESTTRDYSEVLVEILALREELSYQKELNNQFISLLLSIQRKRRELETERKKGKMTSKQKDASNIYLTTVIPYDDHQGAPDADRLQIFIKIMNAIEENSSSVPTLLTDYILKGKLIS